MTHVASSQAEPVLDDQAHLVGVAAFRGLAIFPDAVVAVHRYDGWFDLDGGSGDYRGYALWRFDDGSEIRAEYGGTVKELAGSDFEIEATIQVTSGTGRFAGATGKGTFTGPRIEPIEVGGSTYLKGTLTLLLPE